MNQYKRTHILTWSEDFADTGVDGVRTLGFYKQGAGFQNISISGEGQNQSRKLQHKHAGRPQTIQSPQPLKG